MSLKEILDTTLYYLFQPLPYPVYYNTVSTVLQKLNSYDVDAYNPPTEVFQIRWVDPREIEYVTNRPYPPFANKWSKIGSVLEGDWDRGGDLFIERGDYQAFEAHFINGVKWANLELVQRRIAAVENGDVWKKCRTESEVLDRFRGWDVLYREVRQNGYKNQIELCTEGKESKRFGKAIQHEICVDIGRNGELLFVDGSHRLAIAKLLDIDRIPVQVIVRHRQWMEKRAKLYTDNRVNHPDVPKRTLVDR